jgi:thermitase
VAGVLLLLAAIAATESVLAAPMTSGTLRPLADPFINPSFERVWTRTDWLIKFAGVPRSWYWGPEARRATHEVFNEAPGHVRLVQYFEKSRMEPNILVGQPTPPPNSKWAVTNGLLVVELIAGQQQKGVSRWENYRDANIPLASDVDDPAGPTYTTFRALSNTPVSYHPADDRTGRPVIAVIVNRSGQVQDDPGKQGLNVSNVQFIAETRHNIPNVFWAFLNSVGPVREDGVVSNQQLSDPWFFATGFPISEAYWARVKVGGAQKDVLVQAFERRVLTYNPTNPAGFQVEMGNVGLHYFDWRYPSGLPGPVPTRVP